MPRSNSFNKAKHIETGLVEFIARSRSFLEASETPFGQLLVRYKTERALTNLELTRLSGLPLGSVGAYMTGRVAPPVEDAQRLASSFGLDEAESKRFMTSAKRAKAWAQKDARPYIEQREAEIRENLARMEKRLEFIRELINLPQVNHAAPQ